MALRLYEQQVNSNIVIYVTASIIRVYMSPRVNVAPQEEVPSRVNISLDDHIFSPVSRRRSTIVSARTQSVATYRTVSGIGVLNESTDSIEEEA